MLKRLLFILLLFTVENLHCQYGSKFYSVHLGRGEIKSNSPAQSVFSFGASFGKKIEFWENIDVELKYTFAREEKYFLPENSEGKYYPFIHSLELKGFVIQELAGKFFSSQGLGPLIIHDNVFSDRSSLDFGVAFCLMIGLDFAEKADRSKYILSADFGETFTNNAPGYFIISLKWQKYF